MATARRLRAVPMLVLACGAATAVGQTRPTTTTTPALPTTNPMADLRAKAYLETAKGVADRPLLPPAAMADVAAVGRVGDHLRVTTRQPPTDVPSRIVVTDLPRAGGGGADPAAPPGVSTLTVTRLRSPFPPPPTTVPTAGFEPYAMLFDQVAFDQPGAVDVGTTVAVFPATVQLSQTVETVGDLGDVQVTLIEQRRPPPPTGGEPGVRLRVAHPGVPHPPPDVDLTADSFGQLCRSHPAEVARYVEPILRALRADVAALPPERSLAYQAFAADVAVDPATAARVKALVEKLDADDFHDRDAAEGQLRGIGPVAATALGQVDPATLSPEQRARTSAVLRHFRPVGDAEAGRLGGDVDFLLNCLKVEGDPFVTVQATARLGRVAGHPVDFDDRLAGRPRLEAIWSLRQRLTDRPATRP